MTEGDREEVLVMLDNVCAQVNAALAAQRDYTAELVKQVNIALKAVMESKRVELVKGPTAIKRIQRDEAGNLLSIEEYGTLSA